MGKKCKVCGDAVDCGVVLHRGCYDSLTNQWVSTADRLPSDDELVLVVLSGKYKNITFTNAIEFASYVQGDGWIIELLPEWELPQVSHWMRLPELPNDL